VRQHNGKPSAIASASTCAFFRVDAAEWRGSTGISGQPNHFEDIYGLSWADHVANPRNSSRLLATGYSCRSQVKSIDGTVLRHPIQMLLARIKAPTEGKSRDAEYSSAALCIGPPRSSTRFTE
jgi:hypothetical protein